jgi:signal peptidase I
VAIAAPTLTKGGARQWADHAARVLLVASGAGVLALLVLPLLGLRTLVVQSGSMAPAIGTGDMVVSKVISPSEASVGDVVTFRDPSRDSELVTHRVVEKQDQGGAIAFVTKGDANEATEDWTIEGSGTMGKVVFHIPKAGYLVAWATLPAVRAGLLIGAALIFAVIALRWIWGR